jgi:sulfopyruvate decarboxylase TPP-binding subunit
VPATDDKRRLSGGAIIAAIKQNQTFRLIRVCKEDECVGIASGP